MHLLIDHGQAILFYLFAAAALGCAVLVVSLRNPMYSALSLLGTFLSVAALFLLRHAELVAIIQVFVYGGGIMVLFLFVIMLVNLHRAQAAPDVMDHFPVALAIALLLAALFGFAFLSSSFDPAGAAPERLASVGGEVRGNSEAVAWALYRDYLLPFEIASLFLLVAMIGAVVLGREE